ncbi:DUF3152 domain-containing protein [Amycolatopsis sp. NPDC004368]
MVFAVGLAGTMLVLPTAVQPRRVTGTALGATAAAPLRAAATVPLPVDSAALPDGAPFAATGAGTWHVVPGASGAREGTGAELLTYTVEAEDGIGGDDQAFATEVDATLADLRSWIGLGAVSLLRVDAPDARPDFRVSLTSPGTSRRPDLCGAAIPFDTSCNLPERKRVVINLARWVRGAHAYDGHLADYRHYAVNHEVGHALGHGHAGCPADGGPAPVMMQQTFGLSDDHLARLNRSDPSAGSPVVADGKVCRANPWVR